MSWWYYSRPAIQKVKGGIKAQSKRGDFGQSWWAKRWTQVLDGYDIGERLGRGKTYARKGQVERIAIRKGGVSAVVHGSWTYKVVIEMDTLDESQWREIADAIFTRPATAARLLAGTMPEEMEDVFADLGLDLFPGPDDIRTDCTCPDWANPCKHIAAVYLLLGEEFDRDPFLIFRLRGIERSELLKFAGIDTTHGGTYTALARVGGKRASGGRGNNNNNSGIAATAANAAAATAAATAANTSAKKASASAPDPDAFWGRMSDDRARDYDLGHASVPAVPAALVKQLGSFPFWRGDENFMERMEAIYQSASKEGVRVFLGESADMYDDDYDDAGDSD